MGDMSVYECWPGRVAQPWFTESVGYSLGHKVLAQGSIGGRHADRTPSIRVEKNAYKKRWRKER